MKVKADQIIGALIIIASGIVMIISEFMEWTNGNTAFNLVSLADYDSRFLIYTFPLLSGIGIIVIGFLINIPTKGYRFVAYVLLIITLNLVFYFLAEMFNAHGQYLWNYAGIFYLIGGILALFIGVLMILLSSQKADENT